MGSPVFWTNQSVLQAKFESAKKTDKNRLEKPTKNADPTPVLQK